jgi:hypothetical protein
MADEKWVVLSTRLYTLHPDGNGNPRRQKKHFRGDVLTGLSEEDVRRFTKARAIAPDGSPEAKAAQGAPESLHPSELSIAAAAAPTAAAVVAEPSAAPAAPTTSIVSVSDGAERVSRPPKSATKDKLVAYAVDSGQMTEEQAQATSRNELRDKLK